MVKKKKQDKLDQEIKERKLKLKRNNLILKVYGKSAKQRSKYVLAEFDEPVLELLRRNKRTETYIPSKANKLKEGKFAFTHSNGEDREVDLNEAYIYKADYAGKTYSKYFFHEDWAYPVIPQNPLLEFKRMQNAINNAMSAELKWKAEEKRANAAMITAAAGLVAILVIGWIIYIVVKPEEAVPQTITVVQDTATGQITATKGG